MEKVITAYSINGSDIIDFEYNEHTGLYHWNGDENYCGYTAEELASRRIDAHTDEIGWDEIENADIAAHTGDPAPTPASGTVGAYVRDKIEEYQLEDIVVDHNADYTYVKVSKIDSSLKAMNFANFVAEAQLVSIRGNEDGSVSCWF